MRSLFLQDYHHDTPQSLLDKIQELLDGYRPKAKAKYLGIVCKVREREERERERERERIKSYYAGRTWIFLPHQEHARHPSKDQKQRGPAGVSFT